MHVSQSQLLSGLKMLAQRMKLPGGDLVFLKASLCGVKCAHVFDEGARGGRRY